MRYRAAIVATVASLVAALALAGGGGGQPANTLYVRAGATGTGTGADWTNACTDFTGSCATLVRGNTYYFAGGTYGSRTFSPTVSGTSTVVIKGATVADHGGAVGWSSAFAVGSGNQAHF